jgi:hypothetical protein
MIYYGSIDEGEYVSFSIPTDGSHVYIAEIRIFDTSEHTLTFEKYSDWKEDWYTTGDTLLAAGTHVAELVTGGTYRVSATGGSGDAVLEIEVV